MEIPKCEDNEGTVKEEHCWHPGSMAARAPMSQRCCYCGLDFRIQQGNYLGGKKHGKHSDHRVGQNYQLAFDTTYQDMYKEDPESFEKIYKAMDEAYDIMEELNRTNPIMKGF